MARQKMVEVKCDRCQRLEYVPEKESGEKEVNLDLTFRPSDGEMIIAKFDDLCGPCEKTVSNLIESIRREIKGKSPDRKSEAKKEGDDSPSIEVATQPSSASEDAGGRAARSPSR